MTVEPSADYARHALPVLAAYTQQTVLAVDLDRMRHTMVVDGAPGDELAFIDALITFRKQVLGLRVNGGLLT